MGTVSGADSGRGEPAQDPVGGVRHQESDPAALPDAERQQSPGEGAGDIVGLAEGEAAAAADEEFLVPKVATAVLRTFATVAA